MKKSFGFGAACLFIATTASAQVQLTPPGSGAANNATVGYTQTQQPQASGSSAGGPASTVQLTAPGSGAANNAAVGYNQTTPAPAAAAPPAPAEPPRVIQNFAPGSGAANSATVGYSQK